MKAILVIDMPSDCVGCNQFAFECCHAMKRDIDKECITQIKRPSWCPLKPMPNKKEIQNENGYYDLSQLLYEGWNACLEEITGETE